MKTFNQFFYESESDLERALAEAIYKVLRTQPDLDAMDADQFAKRYAHMIASHLPGVLSGQQSWPDRGEM